MKALCYISFAATIVFLWLGACVLLSFMFSDVPSIAMYLMLGWLACIFKPLLKVFKKKFKIDEESN